MTLHQHATTAVLAGLLLSLMLFVTSRASSEACSRTRALAFGLAQHERRPDLTTLIALLWSLVPE